MSLWQNVAENQETLRIEYVRRGQWPHISKNPELTCAVRALEAIKAPWSQSLGFDLDYERLWHIKINLETDKGLYPALFYRIKIPKEKQKRRKFEDYYLVHVVRDTYFRPASYNPKPTFHITGGGWFVSMKILREISKLVREDRLQPPD